MLKAQSNRENGLYVRWIGPLQRCFFIRWEHQDFALLMYLDEGGKCLDGDASRVKVY